MSIHNSGPPPTPLTSNSEEWLFVDECPQVWPADAPRLSIHTRAFMDKYPQLRPAGHATDHPPRIRVFVDEYPQIGSFPFVGAVFFAILREGVEPPLLPSRTPKRNTRSEPLTGFSCLQTALTPLQKRLRTGDRSEPTVGRSLPIVDGLLLPPAGRTGITRDLGLPQKHPKTCLEAPDRCQRAGETHECVVGRKVCGVRGFLLSRSKPQQALWRKIRHCSRSSQVVWNSRRSNRRKADGVCDENHGRCMSNRASRHRVRSRRDQPLRGCDKPRSAPGLLHACCIHVACTARWLVHPPPL